jgi:hypothetical protein
MSRDKTLDRALDRMRKPGATLELTYAPGTVSGAAFTSSRTASASPTRRRKSYSNTRLFNPTAAVCCPAIR